MRRSTSYLADPPSGKSKNKIYVPDSELMEEYERTLAESHYERSQYPFEYFMKEKYGTSEYPQSGQIDIDNTYDPVMLAAGVGMSVKLGQRLLPAIIDELTMGGRSIVKGGINLAKGSRKATAGVNAFEKPAKTFNGNVDDLSNISNLHLKSTMSDGAISKIVDKSGMVNTDQALAIIAKESGGAAKVDLVKKGLGDNIPSKMNYDKFRKTVQDQLIPLDKQLHNHSSSYGIERLGYKENPYNPIEDWTDYADRLDAPSFVEYLKYKRKGNLLENNTITFSNKRKLGLGSGKHDNPEETLGHIHYLVDSETPKTMTITQIQSDYFQSRIKRGIETAQKRLLRQNHQERYLQEMVGYAGRKGMKKVRVPTSETAAKVQGYTKGKPSSKFISSHTNDRRHITTMLEKHGENSPEFKNALAKYENLKKQNAVPGYSENESFILKKYAQQPKTIKKLYGKEPSIVTDSRGNSWYEFDIPKSFKEGKGEIKALGLIPAVGVVGTGVNQVSANSNNQTNDIMPDLTTKELKYSELLELVKEGKLTPDMVYKITDPLNPEYGIDQWNKDRNDNMTAWPDKEWLALHKTGSALEASVDTLAKNEIEVLRNSKDAAYYISKEGAIINFFDPSLGFGGLGRSDEGFDPKFNMKSIGVEFSARAGSKGENLEGITDAQSNAGKKLLQHVQGNYNLDVNAVVDHGLYNELRGQSDHVDYFSDEEKGLLGVVPTSEQTKEIFGRYDENKPQWWIKDSEIEQEHPLASINENLTKLIKGSDATPAEKAEASIAMDDIGLPKEIKSGVISGTIKPDDPGITKMVTENYNPELKKIVIPQKKLSSLPPSSEEGLGASYVEHLNKARINKSPVKDVISMPTDDKTLVMNTKEGAVSPDIRTGDFPKMTPTKVLALNIKTDEPDNNFNIMEKYNLSTPGMTEDEKKLKEKELALKEKSLANEDDFNKLIAKNEKADKALSLTSGLLNMGILGHNLSKDGPKDQSLISLSPDTVKLQTPDILTPAKKEIDRGFNTGRAMIRERGIDAASVIGLTSERNRAITAVTAEQGNLDAEIKNKESLINAEITNKSKLTEATLNAEITARNAEKKHQDEQMKGAAVSASLQGLLSIGSGYISRSGQRAKSLIDYKSLMED